jgi:SET domain-containing protein
MRFFILRYIIEMSVLKLHKQTYTIEQNEWIHEMHENGCDGTLLTDLFHRRFGSDMTHEKNKNTPMSWYFRNTKK